MKKQKFFFAIKTALMAAVGIGATFCSESFDLSMYQDKGLLYVNIQSPYYVPPNAPVATGCGNWKDYPSAACIRESECYGLHGADLEICVDKWRAAIQNGTYTGAVSANHDDDEHDDDAGDDDDDDDQRPQVKVNIEIQSIEVRENPDSPWINISDESDLFEADHDDEDGSESIKLDLADLNLNERVGARELAVKTYSEIRVNFGDKNKVWQLGCPASSQGNSGSTQGNSASVRHDEEHRQRDQKDEKSQKRQDGEHKKTAEVKECNGYIKFPLNFEEGALRSVVIHKEFSVDSLELLEISLAFDIDQSISAGETGEFIFHPELYVKEMTGGGYHQPEEAINVEVAGTTGVRFEAPPFATTEPIKVTATAVTQNTIPTPLADSKEKLLAGYEFQPSTIFEKPVTVTIPYDKAALSRQGFKPEQIHAKYYNENTSEWIDIPTATVDPVTGEVAVVTNHFTIIAIVGGGFTLDHPAGFVTKISYEFFNNYLKKVLPISMPQFDLNNGVVEDTEYDPNAAAQVIVTHQLFDIDTRDFTLDISAADPATNMVWVTLKANRPFYVGDIKLVTYGSYYDKCDQANSNCKAGCGGFFKSLCEGACNLTRLGCYALATVGNLAVYNSIEKRISINNFELALPFQVTHDQLTNTVKFDLRWDLFTGFRKLDFSYSDKSLPVGFLVWFLEAFLADLPFKQVITWNDVFEIGVTQEVYKYAREMAAKMNESFADPNPAMSDLQVTATGLSYKNRLVSEFPDAIDKSLQCAFAPNVPVPADQAVPFELVSSSHFGFGLSLNAMEQVFATQINRGQFCLNQTDAVGNRLQVTPHGNPKVVYLGNYLLRQTITATVTYTPVVGPQISQTGSLLFTYRVKANPAQRVVGFDLAFFQNTLNVPMDMYQAFLDKMQLNLNMPALLSYGGLQTSMLKFSHFDRHNGNLHFEYKMEGIKDSAGREWIWTKNWMDYFKEGTTKQKCRPYIYGTLQPGGTTFALEGGPTIGISNQGIAPAVYASLVNTKAYLSGTCIGNFGFVAKNVLNDHFPVKSDNTIGIQGGSPFAKVDNFAGTVGRYKVKIPGVAAETVLQITKDPNDPQNPLAQQLHWYVGQVKSTMPLPPEAATGAGIFRVSVEAMPQGDQLLLNCSIYNLAFDGTKVTLTRAYDYCANSTPGVIRDDMRGVMWSKCALGQGAYDPNCSGAHQGYEYFEHSWMGCRNLNLAGFSDWDLPTPAEFSLIGNPAGGGSIDTTLFPNSYGRYWTKYFSWGQYCYIEEIRKYFFGIWYDTDYVRRCNNYGKKAFTTFPGVGGMSTQVEWYKNPYYSNCNVTNTPFHCVPQNYYTSMKTRCMRKMTQ